MKNKFTKLLTFGLTLFAIGLLMTNCEKESTQEESITVENQEPTLTLKHYSKTNIEKNTKLVSKLKEFNDKVIENKSSKLTGKNVYNKEYDFTIYTDSAIYIEDGDYHSYTFPIVQGTEETITNILFELNDENEYDAFIVEYDYSANDLKDKDFKSLSMKTSMRPIDLDFSSLFSKATTKSAYVCVYSYNEECSGGTVDGHGGIAFQNCSWVLKAEHCETVLYYDEDYKEYHQGNTATITIGGTTYGGTGGSTTSPMPSPFNAEELAKIDVVKNRLNLNHPERLWIDKWENGKYAFKLHDFGAANMWSDEAKVFAKSAFDDMKLGKKVDLEESFASPFNVDLELVRPTVLNPEPEKIKFMCIYNKLIKSQKFKKLFVDTFGDSENMHVQFKIVNNISPTPPSTTEPNGVTKTRALSVNPTTGEIVKYNAVIEINKSNMGISSISLAKTILHESIHAYLTVKQYGCNQGTSLEGYDDVELSELLNMYFSTACPTQSDHEFMFDSLLPIMSEILADIKDDLIPLSHQQSAEEDYSFIDESNPTGPEVPWDWNQFFKYLSMAGLQNSDAFQFEMLPTTSTKHQNFNSYISIGIGGFSPNCND